jgi:membrane protein DedA with SNARE-associated domain
MSTIAHLVHAYGLIVVAGVIGLECLGLPVPGETFLVLASIFAEDDLRIILVVLTAGSAAVVGQMLGYAIGREFGYRLLLRYGFYLRITESRIKLGQYLFLRHGGKIVFIARFVPLLRSIAGILAGANRMPWRHFMLANVIGAFAWAAFFGFAAYYLGQQVERLATPMVVAVGIAAVVFVIVAAKFVSGHEAQLTAEAERALPGPLKWP